MEKRTVTVRIPALGGSFEFMIPKTMIINDVKSLIIQILASEFGIKNQLTDAFLFDMADQTRLPEDYSLEELAITDGTSLILV